MKKYDDDVNIENEVNEWEGLFFYEFIIAHIDWSS